MESFSTRQACFSASACGNLILDCYLGESIAQSWRLANYKHPSEVEGVRIGDLEKDVVFFNGNSAVVPEQYLRPTRKEWLIILILKLSIFPYSTQMEPCQLKQSKTCHKFGGTDLHCIVGWFRTQIHLFRR